VPGVVFDGNLAQAGLDFLETGAVRSDEVAVVQPVAQDDREHRGEEVGIRSRPQLQVDVGVVRGLGATRVDDDERPFRVPAQMPQRIARARDAVRLVRVAADEEDVVRMLDVLCRVAGLVAEQPSVYPEVAGLLLPERVVGVAALHCCEQLPAVGAAQVIALAATAEAGEGLAAVAVADRDELVGDFLQGLVPADALVAAVGRALERVGQPIGVVLVVLEPCCLLAQVATGIRVILVAPNAREATILDLDLQPAVT